MDNSRIEKRDLRLIDSFMEYLALERGASDNTCDAYFLDVKRWFAFCRSNAIDPRRPESFHFERYMEHLKKSDIADSTIQRRTAALRTWIVFLTVEGYVDEDVPLPALPSRTEKLPQLLTEGEMERLLETCDVSGAKAIDMRDRAMLELLYGCALRASELCNLSVKDLHIDQGSITVLGKGNKERVVPLAGSCKRWIVKYLDIVRPNIDNKGTDKLFLSSRGGPFHREGLWRMIQKRGKLAGISSKRLHPHVIRHTVASLLLKRGMDLRTLQEFLGHNSIATTEKYLHFDQELRDVYDKCHPRA